MGENRRKVTGAAERMQGEMEAAVASPSSAAAAAPSAAGRLHPTYKEMIMQALTELRDPCGSSRGAIANYIAGHFSGLHSRHDALLSVHLRKLESHGQLRVAEGNYFVSTAAAPGQKRGRGRPRKNPDSALVLAFQCPTPKRGRGRPRKNASPLQGGSAPPPPPSGVKRGRGRPRKNALALVLVPSSSALPLGASDPPNALDPVASSPLPLQALPPPSGVKRGRGSPRKNALVPVSSSHSQLLGAIAPPPPSGIKRGRGRPRKNVPVRSSFSHLLGAMAPPPPFGFKRGRGRPRKNAFPAVAPLVVVEQGAAGGQPQWNATPLSLPPATMPHRAKLTPVRPFRVAVDVNALRGSSMNISACSDSVVGGELKMQPESVQSADASLTEKKMTEGQLEALTVQAADQAGAVQNEVEARDLQSLGTPLTEKRGRGRPRKRPLQTETAEAGVAASTVKRGRGRPRKRRLQTETAEAGVAASTMKRGCGRPRKEKTLETGDLKFAQMTEGQREALSPQAVDQTGPMQDEFEARILQSLGTLTEKKMTESQQEALTAQAAEQAGAVQNEVETRDLQSLGTPSTEKRGRGRPRKRPLVTEIAEAGAASTVKRGRGRPRKEKTLETGDLKVAQMTEGQHEAQPAQAVDQSGPMENELNARILQSFGTPLMEKRGRGRPRKKPLDTETAKTQVDALVKKRGRGRPRKARPFETVVEVSRDLTEDGPEKDGDLVSGKKAESQSILLAEGIDDGPADA